jgi:diguanylate cyclase (GGDEF)-like protein/PAS domain S-box-containing protein
MNPVSNRRIGIPSLVALLLAVLWALAGYRAWAERERVIAAKEVELNKLVIAVEEQTLRLFRLTEATLIATSRWVEEHPGIYPGQNPTFIDLVANLKRLSDDTLELRILDTTGGAHLVPAPTHQAVANLADREHFRVQQNPQTRGLYISDPVLSHVNQRWVIPVSHPVLAADKQFSVITAAIQLDRITRPFEAQRLKPNGSITLLKTNGATLFRTPAIEGAIGKNIAQAPDFIEHLKPKERGLYRVRGAFDGVERMIGHARLQSYPVIIAVTASVDDALLPWWRELYQLLAFVLGVSVLALVLSHRAVRAARIAQQKLAGSEQRFRTLIEHAPDAILVFDADEQRVVDANPMAEKLFERTRGELLSGSIERFYAPLQPDGLPVGESIRAAQQRSFRGESVLVERHLLSLSGQIKIVEVRIDDISEAGRHLVRGSFIDITQRKAAETALRESETRLRVLMETSPLPMLIATPPPEGKTLMLNERFAEVIGYSLEDIPDLNAWWPRAYPDPGYRIEVLRLWDEALRRMIEAERHSLLEPFTGELTCKDGARRFVEIHMSIYADRCLIVFNDLTQRRTYEQELARIAHYDILTNLPNRRLLTDRMEQAIARTRRKGRMLAVCYLDLDQFKPVNDLHGHDAGDKVLVEAARRMSEAIRVEDTAARLGGDEFVLLLADIEQIDECGHVLARVISSLALPFVLNETVSVGLSASIGVALFPEGGEMPDELMRNADQAMYAAKQAGRNRINFFVPQPRDAGSD